MSIVNTILSRRGRADTGCVRFLRAGASPSLYIPQRWSVAQRPAVYNRKGGLLWGVCARLILAAGLISRKKKRQQPEKPTAGVIVADRVGFEPTSRLRDYLISSLVRTWHFRVCCGRWRQFWKRRKPLCCNGFWTHRPVLTSSISEKTRVQIEMRSAPKRSFFARWQENTQEENPCPVWLCGQPPWIKCKKNRLKTDYTKYPFGPKHRKEPSL